AEKEFEQRSIQSVHPGAPRYYVVEVSMFLVDNRSTSNLTTVYQSALQNASVPSLPVPTLSTLTFRQALKDKYECAKLIEAPVDASLVGFTSDRERLTNPFINHFRIHHFINLFLPNNHNTAAGKVKLYNFVHGNNSKWPQFATIASAATSLFAKLETFMSTSSEAYMFRRLVVQVHPTDKIDSTKAFNPLVDESFDFYYDHWINLILMLCRVLFRTN
ncbi:hypothetical protein MBANPS3_007590, partial [Mucor bainieri]